MEDQQTEGASQRHRHANKGRKVVSQPHRHGDSAQKSAYGIAQVEGGLDAAATQHFATLGMLHDQKLLRRPDAEKTDTADEHQHHRDPTNGGEEEGEQEGGGGQKLEVAGETARHEAVGKQGAHLIAHDHTATSKNHQERDAGRAESALRLQQRRDVAKPAEDAAIAQEGGRNEEPWRRR